MIDRRITACVLAGSAALATAGCQQHGAATGNQAAPGNAVAGKTVFGAPTPTPAPTPTANPGVTPTPRSIMQPNVIDKPILPPPPMPISETVGFPDGGAKLDDAAKQQLDQLASDPVTASGGPIVLRGSSDSRGSDADNKAVSKRRAEAVAAYLESKGIAKERMSIIALGEDRPVAPNAKLDGSDNPEGRARNRRVDVTVTPGSQDDPAPSASSDAPGNAQNQRE